MGRPAKPKITKTNGIANGFPESITLEYRDREREFVQKDNDLYHCFKFCKWLENLPRGTVAGATQLFRKYLEETQDK